MVAALGLALEGCGGDGASFPTQVEPVFSGLRFDRITDIQSQNDAAGNERLFVVEKAGRVLFLDPTADSPTAEPYLDISGLADLDTSGEQGLLGLAFDPDYATNGYFYVHVVKSGTGPRRVEILRFRDDGTPPVDADTAVLVLQVTAFDSLRERSNHVAGGLAFGPVDGLLYLTMGDGGGSFDPDGAAQDLDDLRGSILRIDTAGTTAGGPDPNYTIPPGNPLVGADGADEIFAWGLRNPFRISIERVDATTQRVWVGDVGQNRREEVNVVREERNYGWDCFEGTVDLRGTAQASGACDAIPTADFEPPVHEYDHSLGQSITGGYVYSGDRLAGTLTGHYVYGDFVSGRIWALDPETGHDRLLVDTTLNISTFGTGANGALYIGDYSGSGGELYRLTE